MELTRCLLGKEINKMLKDLVNIPRNIVISVGATGCLNVLYNEAIKYNKRNLLYTFPVDEIDMISGEHIKKLEILIEEIIKERYKDIDSIIIYETCTDLLIGSNFKLLIKKIVDKYGIIVKVLERGPISKRKILPRERLEKLIVELQEDLKSQNKKINNFNIKAEDSKGKVQHFIPPIVSDYSGACSALYSPKILKIVISPGGCRTPVIYDEIRNIDNSLVYCTKMGEMEVLLGEEGELVKKIEEVIKNEKIEMIALIRTVIPSFTGMDIENIGEILEKKYKIPTIVLNSNSFENYYSGISTTFLTLGKKFLAKENIKKRERSINIIGYTPLTFGKIENLSPLFDEIKQLKLNIEAIFSHEISLEKIKNSINANLNIVLSHEGIPLAEFMKKEFDIPYLIINLVGKYGMEQTKIQLSEFLNLQVEKKIYFEVLQEDQRKVLIISSPFMAKNLAESLKKDFNIPNTKPVSFLRKNGKLKKIYKGLEKIELIDEEEKLLKLIEEYNPDILIGDLVYKEMIPKEKVFIPLTHSGYSTRLNMKQEYYYCGEEGYKYFKSFL